MAARLESTAYFASRARALGFTTQEVDQFEAAELNSLGKFAFCCSTQPGSGDEAPFLAILEALWTTDAGNLRLSSLTRRLWFESFTANAEDMRLRISRTDDEPARKMPRVEREKRLDDIRDRLKGRKIIDQMEPGASVLDHFETCAEEDLIRYLPWKNTVSASFETKHGKAVEGWKPNSDGVVTKFVEKHVPVHEIGTDKFQLAMLLDRRAVAMEGGRLLCVEDHDALKDIFFEALDEESPDPANYGPISIAQVAKADKEVFSLLGKKLRSGIARLPTGEFPLSVHWHSVITSPKIQQILTHLPLTKGDAAPPRPQQSEWGRRGDPATNGSPRPQTSGKQGGKGSGKGNGKAAKKNQFTPTVPKEAVGKNCVNKFQDSPICFAYNLDTCTSTVAPGAKCPRGFHVCFQKGCFKHHSWKSTHS